MPQPDFSLYGAPSVGRTSGAAAGTQLNTQTGAGGFAAASSALTPEWWILSRLTTRTLILTKSRNDGAAGHVNFLVNKSAKLYDACEQCGPPQMEAPHLLLSFQPLWIYFFLMQSCQWWYIWTRNQLWLKDNVYVTGRRVQLIITGKEKKKKKSPGWSAQ